MSENVFKQYDSIDLARHIMAVCDENNIIFEKNNGNTKLNKLLYIVYGVYLSIYNKSILTEKPKCFPYGPVFPRVFKKYIKLESQKLNLEKNLENIIQEVIKKFGNWKAGELSAWSHEDGSPWQIIFKKSNNKYGSELNDNDIIQYFKNKVICYCENSTYY